MNRYHPVLVVLHWLLALLILGALIAGMAMDDLANNDPAKLSILRLHMISGVTIGVLMLVRLVVRWRTQKPPQAHTGHVWLDRSAVVAHWALYALVIAMVFTGLGLSAGAGLPAIVFGGTGTLPESFSEFPARAGHGLFASLLMVLILLHLSAVVYHQWILKDRLLRRMSLTREDE